jgi:hypothetical protein
MKKCSNCGVTLSTGDNGFLCYSCEQKFKDSQHDIPPDFDKLFMDNYQDLLDAEPASECPKVICKKCKTEMVERDKIDVFDESIYYEAKCERCRELEGLLREAVDVVKGSLLGRECYDGIENCKLEQCQGKCCEYKLYNKIKQALGDDDE